MTTVNELIEWVDLEGITLCYAMIAYGDDEIGEEIMDCYRDTFAKQILSHPDLALIDRNKGLPTMDCSDCEDSEDCAPNDCVKADGYYSAQVDYKQADYEPVIPLAEAIMNESSKE